MKPPSDQTIVRNLRDLVAALDRRVPRSESDTERAIVRDAEELRRDALRRICELEALRPARSDFGAAEGIA